MTQQSPQSGDRLDAETWTEGEQVDFSAWLARNYPNEPSAGVIALGSAWKDGKRAGLREPDRAATASANHSLGVPTTTPAPEAKADALRMPPVELRGVAETLASGDGFWRTCAGCHESEDGQPFGDYPYSEILNCDLGAGCSDCGGVGAVWDNTDYEAMGHAMEQSLAPASADHAAQVSELARELLDALQTVVKHFTKTPSTLADSKARGKAHEVIGKAYAVLGYQGSAT
jgi:hypothetical protein